jgi:hypothetical protein
MNLRIIQVRHKAGEAWQYYRTVDADDRNEMRGWMRGARQSYGQVRSIPKPESE